MAKNLSSTEWEELTKRVEQHDKKLEQLLDILNEIQANNEELKQRLKLALNENYGAT